MLDATVRWWFPMAAAGTEFADWVKSSGRVKRPVRNGSPWSGAIRKRSVESDQRRVARWRERGAGSGASGTDRAKECLPRNDGVAHERNDWAADRSFWANGIASF